MTVVDRRRGDRTIGRVEPLVSVGFPVCVHVCVTPFSHQNYDLCLPSMVYLNQVLCFVPLPGEEAGPTLLGFGIHKYAGYFSSDGIV